MKSFLFLLWAFLPVLAAAQPPLLDPAKTYQTIAFGSCNEQDDPQPVWKAITAANPDAFVFLGDNIYGDTHDMEDLRAKYAKLGANTGFAAFRAKVPVLATWDDHDYGTNDCGKEHPEKVQSKEIFLEFFREPANSPRRRHTGIYDSYIVGPQGKKIQFIILDERTFRNAPTASAEPETDSTGNYIRVDGAEMLGEEQWKWLEKQLKKPADLRIICSSTQFVSEFSGYELWALYPKEKQRMLDLLKATKANGVIFISGDVHIGEISKQPVPGFYPIWDVTSSGLTETWRAAPPNRFRQGMPVMPRNFGLLKINWNQPDPRIVMEIHGEDGTLLLKREVKLSELKTR